MVAELPSGCMSRNSLVAALLIYSLSVTALWPVGRSATDSQQLLEELRGLPERQLVEIHLVEGPSVMGRIVNVTNSSVFLETAKNRPAREIRGDQIKSFRTRKNSHWIRWTILGGVVVVVVVLVAYAAAVQGLAKNI